MSARIFWPEGLIDSTLQFECETSARAPAVWRIFSQIKTYIKCAHFADPQVCGYDLQILDVNNSTPAFTLAWV
jgi:hypothetical protein